jgi:hypothetical protein
MDDPFHQFFQRKSTVLSFSRRLTAGDTRSSPAASNGTMELAASQDIAPHFGPLGFILAGSRVTQVPAMAPTTGATPETA